MLMKFSSQAVEGRDHLRDLGIDGRIIVAMMALQETGRGLDSS